MCSAVYFLWGVKFTQLVDATCITLKKSKTNKQRKQNYSVTNISTDHVRTSLGIYSSPGLLE